MIRAAAAKELASDLLEAAGISGQLAIDLAATLIMSRVRIDEVEAILEQLDAGPPADPIDTGGINGRD